MSKFKVGDRVRLLGEGDHLVTDIAFDGNLGCEYVYLDGDDRDSMRGWDDASLKLIESAPEPAIDAHYTKYAIQPMEFSLANGLDPAQHTVIKYTVRYRDKGGVRDLRAAIRVLELMIEREERKASDNG